jgi:hypothetical protein
MAFLGPFYRWQVIKRSKVSISVFFFPLARVRLAYLALRMRFSISRALSRLLFLSGASLVAAGESQDYLLPASNF